MSINRCIVATAATTLTLTCAPGLAHAAQPAVATTHIVPIGKTNSGTGTSAAPPITADVVTVDTGNTIDTTGVGTGFQKVGLYVSVLYENGSQVTGPRACLPAGKVPFGARVIGAWVPDGSTTRTLAPVTEIGQAYQGGKLVGSWDKGTISVRRVDLIKPPMLYANLQACGRVNTVSAASAAASNLWSNSLSSVFTQPSTAHLSVPSLAAARQTPVNPIAPGLIIGQTPTTVPVVSHTAQPITKVITEPGKTVTVTSPVTVTAPKVTTVTTPLQTVTTTHTVTLPGVTVTVP